MKQYCGLVPLIGMNFRWSSAGEEDEHAKAFGELAEKGEDRVRSPLVGEVLLRRLFFFVFGNSNIPYFPD